jgi:uncharacterized protein YndB with AHSA1/START domain
MRKEKITVETIIKADVDKAWSHWTSPKHIVNWNFASDDWHCPKAENDLRTGGKFKSTMASRDGKMSFDFEGVYDKVIDRKKIAYSLADGRQVVIVFEKVDNSTKVMESFDPENTNSAEMQRAGWQSILDNFKKYVEGN